MKQAVSSNLFMKIAKVLNVITLNAILSSSFPVRHLPGLFCYLLNTYDQSFLKVFIISHLVLKIFQSFCFLVMPFSDTPNITPKYFAFFIIWYIIWSYPTSIEFSVQRLRCFFNPSSLLGFLSRKLTSCLSLFLSPSVLRSYLGSFFLLRSAFFNPTRPATHALAGLIRLFVSVMLLLFKYLIA